MSQLIESIVNPDKRAQARLQQVYFLARTDPDKARELLEDINIPDELRKQAEQLIEKRSLYR